MNNKTALTGTVLLEAYWATRKKDMLDLIAPFVQYGVAKTTTIGERIDVSKVTQIIRNDFGYSDIPESAVIKVINRDQDHFRKSNKNYYLHASLDDQVERLTHRKIECLSKIDSIGNKLFEYLRMHCRKSKITSKEQCVDFLQEFFSLFALQVGLESLEKESISYKNDEINYYIAQYIFEKKAERGSEYETILDLTKGYLLRTAIYLQIDNPNIGAASYKNTSIYYDTPFLIQLLGCQSEKEADSARSLHSSLKKQGAKFYYFPQNERELVSILTAYQYSLIGQQKSSRTLEGLDSKGYRFEDVNRIKNSFPSILSKEYNIEPHALPAYAVNEMGSVDIDKIDISEKDAMEYVRQHTKHYTDDNLASDVSSALGIHRLRNGISSQSIERCIALFVTTNSDFTKAFNDFYRENVGSNRVMPVITAFDLSAIAWVKGGSVNNDIPERQLLTNSYLALQPSPEIMDRCRSVLTQLEGEGKITEEEAISLRADRVTQRELWIEYFPAVESIDENYIEKLRERQRQRLIGETKAELANQYKQESKRGERLRAQEAQQKAKDYALLKRAGFVTCFKVVLIVLFGAIATGCIVGLIKSLEPAEKTACLFLFIIVSVLSIIDTLTSRSKLIGKWIEKRANYYETIVYEKKLKEYMSLLNADEVVAREQ